MPENLQYVDIPEPETSAATVAPRRLSPTLRVLWVASVVGFVAGAVVMYAVADEVLYSDRSSAMTTAYLVLQPVLQVSGFGILASAVLTWWERRGASGR